MSTAPQAHFPRIDATIPHDVQRHLRLIYETLGQHAAAFQALPQSTSKTPAPVTVKTLFPRIDSAVPHEISRHLQLIYGALNNHAIAFTQLPKLNSTGTAQPTAAPQTFDAKIEPTIPHDVQVHLQLIYGKLTNHTLAFDFYKTHMPADSTAA
jgi:hypothetical protein